MNPVLEILIAGLLVTGAGFVFVGSFGLARLPDLVTRLHAPTKAATLGVGALLLASMLWQPATGRGLTAQELLVALFLFLTAPIGGQMIAKSWLHRIRVERGRHAPALPAPPSGSDWATFEGATQVDEPAPKG